MKLKSNVRNRSIYFKIFNERLKYIERYLSFVIDKDIQLELCDYISKSLNQLKKVKHKFVEDNMEKESNAALFFQCAFNIYKSHITMWIKLKENDAYEAWCSLVDIYDYYKYAIMAFKESSIYDDSRTCCFEDYYTQIESIEKSVFIKHPIYNSLGFCFSGGICSICGNLIDDYENCTHIENNIYWGKFCKRMNIEITNIHHGALVENPEDRRCIIQEFTDRDGVTVNFLTKKILSKAHIKEKNGKFKAALYNSRELDIF